MFWLVDGISIAVSHAGSLSLSLSPLFFRESGPEVVQYCREKTGCVSSQLMALPQRGSCCRLPPSSTSSTDRFVRKFVFMGS